MEEIDFILDSTEESMIGSIAHLEKEFGNSNNANYLKKLFQKSYLNHSKLADATRYLANELFQKEGLVILDGDVVSLKELFVPYVKKELLP